MCTTVANKINKNEIISGNDEKKLLDKSEVFANNVRFWYSVLVLMHGFLLSGRLLMIDFSNSELEELRVYHNARWQLTTIWSGLAMFAYYIMTAYCEWKQRSGSPLQPHVLKLNEARHFLFTSLVLPSTLFSDTIFWKTWTANRLLVAPISVDAYVTIYDQHLMHTVAYIIVFLDCLLVERKKPKYKRLHFNVLFWWCTIYHAVLQVATMNGVYVYPLLRTYSPSDKVVICLMSYCGHFFYYYVQWRFNGILMKYMLRKRKND